MASITITAEVPSQLELCEVEKLAREAVERVVGEMVRDIARKDAKAAALESDAALAKWLNDNDLNDPVVRAQTYAKSNLTWQEVWRYDRAWGTSYGRDDRRPVIMRGALSTLKTKYGCDGWCGRVIERYLRLTKWRCLELVEIRDTLGGLRSRLVKKHPDLGHGDGSRRELRGLDSYWPLFEGGPWWKDDPIVWIDGSRLKVTPDQLNQLRALNKIVVKMDRIAA